jgi:hypothetical protein
MLFTRVLAFATLAMAVPAPSVDFEAATVVKKDVASTVELAMRQTTSTPALGGGPITQAILNATSILNSAIAQNLATFRKYPPPRQSYFWTKHTQLTIWHTETFTSSVNKATDSTIQAVIAGLKSVETALNQSSTALVDGITNASGGLLGVLTSLAATEATNIGNAFSQLVTILTSLGPILTTNLGSVASSLKGPLQAEVAALKALPKPFIAPLQLLVTAVQTVQLSATTKPITDAYAALKTFFTTIGQQI